MLCLPLCLFFIAPLPFAQVCERGHEFKVQPTPGFHRQPWPVTALLAVAVAVYFCFRRLAASNRIETPPQA